MLENIHIEHDGEILIAFTSPVDLATYLSARKTTDETMMIMAVVFIEQLVWLSLSGPELFLIYGLLPFW